VSIGKIDDGECGEATMGVILDVIGGGLLVDETDW
jgi:hypothetical protein